MQGGDELLQSDIAGKHCQDEGPGGSNDEEEVMRSSGCCGPCAGIVEMFSLFCIVPEFWRVALYTFFSAAGALLPAIYYIGPLESQIWKDNATSYSLAINVCKFTVASFGAPLFGMWSDGRPRKISMLITSFAGFACLAPFLFLSGSASLWAWSIVSIITAPFVVQSPVAAAWMTDVIPPEHRETGFSLIFSIGALSTWILGTIVSAMVTALDLGGKTYVYIGGAFVIVSVLLVVTMPSYAPQQPAEDSQQRSIIDTLLSPFRLVARKRSLRLVCGVSAFICLPDVAMTSIAQPIVFVLLGISGDNPVLQTKLANWFSNFPNIFIIFVYAIVGAFAKRFGPARTLAVWTPITCCMFAAPALLALSGPDNPPLEVMCGLMMTSPISLFPPLQALTALIVPPSRIGEAMGTLSACKNVASVCGPLIMGAVVQALGDRHDLYWILFPGAAIFMLAGAWPFVLLLNRRIGDGTETDGHKWSVWSDAAGSVIRGNRMSSRTGNSVTA